MRRGRDDRMSRGSCRGGSGGVSGRTAGGTAFDGTVRSYSGGPTTCPARPRAHGALRPPTTRPSDPASTRRPQLGSDLGARPPARPPRHRAEHACEVGRITPGEAKPERQARPRNSSRATLLESTGNACGARLVDDLVERLAPVGLGGAEQHVGVPEQCAGSRRGRRAARARRARSERGFARRSAASSARCACSGSRQRRAADLERRVETLRRSRARAPPSIVV